MAGVDAPALAEARTDRPAGAPPRPPMLRRLISARRRKFPWLLPPASVIIVALLLSPLVLIVIQAVQTGWSQLWPVLDRPFVGTLLWNTVRLGGVGPAVIGTAAAWLTERTTLPGRQVWRVLLIVPLVVPDFVLSWAWSSVFPSVEGFFGATLVMVLHLYPLVYLPM